MDKIKKILEKIKIYLNNVFKKEKVKLIEANTTKTSEEGINSSAYKKEQETEKEDFFVIYNNVKNGIIDANDLMINDLIKVQLMMQNEMDLYDSKLDVLEDEIADLNTEKNILIKENEMYLKKLQ